MHLETERLCNDKVVQVKKMWANSRFKFPFYSSPDGFKVEDIEPLRPGDRVLIKNVLLSKDGQRVVGVTHIDGPSGQPLCVNLRVGVGSRL